MRSANGRPVSFAAGDLPAGFELRRIVLEPGAERSIPVSEWTDALVVVEAGEIEVETLLGAGATFLAGDVLCLEPIPPRTLRNHGSTPAVLSLVRRSGRVAPMRYRDAP
jgi:hypothetical protein